MTQSIRGSVIAVVGCIPMVPGSLAAKGLMGLFEMIHTRPENAVIPFVTTCEILIVVTFTLIGIGLGLIIPTLIAPDRHAD